MTMGDPVVEYKLYLVKRNIVGMHLSVEKVGFTVVYTVDGKEHLVKESPAEILMMK